MEGLTDGETSVLYGYPICQCCGLRMSMERAEIHDAKRRWLRPLITSEVAPARK